MPVYINERGLFRLFPHNVVIPDFLIERFRWHGGSLRILALSYWGAKSQGRAPEHTRPAQGGDSHFSSWDLRPARVRLFFGFTAFAERDDLRWIDRLAVDLHLDDFAFLVDQIIDAARRFVFR